MAFAHNLNEEKKNQAVQSLESLNLKSLNPLENLDSVKIAEIKQFLQSNDIAFVDDAKFWENFPNSLESVLSEKIALLHEQIEFLVKDIATNNEIITFSAILSEIAGNYMKQAFEQDNENVSEPKRKLEVQLNTCEQLMMEIKKYKENANRVGAIIAENLDNHLSVSQRQILQDDEKTSGEKLGEKGVVSPTNKSGEEKMSYSIPKKYQCCLFHIAEITVGYVMPLKQKPKGGL